MVIRSLLFSTLHFLLAFGVCAQDTALDLNGTLVHGSLRAPQAHHFTIALAAEGWALLRVDQQGVDLAVTTFATNGAKIQEFDSPNGNTGPEWVRLEATSAGRYGIEVRAIDEEATEGRYSIRVVAMGTKPADASAELDALLARFSTHDSPGLAIRVLHHGEVVYSKGTGLADLAHSVPITTRTAFHVGSITKQFTAFSLLLLERDGLLSLDDDVRKFLPELPTYAKPITLRELVQHSAGLRDIDDLLRLRGIGPNDEVTQADAVDLLLRQTGLNFEPGAAFEYSNSGYILLAEVVGRVAGKSFPVFVQERILEPLGMGSSQVLAAPGRIVPHSARSYGLDGADHVERPLNSSFYGSTGLCTSVEDLCKWAANFTSPVVGDHALMERIQRSGVLSTGDPLTYAMGLDHKEYRGLQVVFHGGGIAAYRAYLLRVPEHDLVVAITSNAEDFNPIVTAEKALDVFLAKEIAEAERKKPAVRAKKSRLDALVGDYVLFPGLVFSITREDAGLVTRITGNDGPIPLEEVGENRFQLGDRFNQFVFHLGPNGLADGFAYHLYDFTWQAKRVALAPLRPSDDQVQDLAGLYKSEELGVALVVEQQDSTWVVRSHRWGEEPMRPFQHDSFTTAQAQMAQLRFVRDANGKVTSCLVSGQRALDVRFDRVE